MALVGPTQGGPGVQNVHPTIPIVVLSSAGKGNLPRNPTLSAGHCSRHASPAYQRVSKEAQAQAAPLPKGSWFYSSWKVADSVQSPWAPTAVSQGPTFPVLPHCALEGG